MKINYDKSEFVAMVNDFVADRGEEMEDLIVDDTKFEDGAWKAYAHDAKAAYVLFDDGTQNIEIDYLAAI